MSQKCVLRVGFYFLYLTLKQLKENNVKTFVKECIVNVRKPCLLMSLYLHPHCQFHPTAFFSSLTWKLSSLHGAKPRIKGDENKGQCFWTEMRLEECHCLSGFFYSHTKYAHIFPASSLGAQKGTSLPSRAMASELLYIQENIRTLMDCQFNRYSDEKFRVVFKCG